MPKIIVKAMFQKLYVTKLPEIEDLKLKSCLENVSKSGYEYLFENNTVPTGNLEECKYIFTINYVVLSNFVAIERFI